MAYRFIDTGFFRSPFVRDLKAPLKSLYSYIITDCSPAGIWTVDLPIAEIYTGHKLPPEDVTSCFLKGGKAMDLGNGKWFFPDFIQHQYPKGLSDKNPAHNNVILELKKYNLIDENLRVLVVPSESLQRDSKGTMVMVKDKVMEMDKVMVKVNGAELKKFSPPSKEEVITFFTSHNYTTGQAEKAYNYYAVANWHDSKGNPVRNWKQKMLANWMKELPGTKTEAVLQAKKFKEL